MHSSITVAHDTDGCVAVLKARIPNNKGTYVFLPGGRQKPGETAEECARRELREETGVNADKWRALGSYAVTLSSPVRLSLFLAEDLSLGPQQLTPAEEGFTLMWWSMEEAIDAAAAGRFLLYGGPLALFLADRVLKK